MRESTGRERELQRTDALERANMIRQGRAAVRRGMKAGELSLGDALRNPYVQTMRLADLIDWLPGVGELGVNRALRQTQISAYAYVGRLTDRQRALLTEWVVS